MLYYKNNKWHICSEKVRYTQNEAELENHVGVEGNKWWEENPHIENVEFIDIEVVEEQVIRLEEVNKANIGDGYSEVLGKYVIDNQFPVEINHILRDLQNKKENELLQRENSILKAQLQANNDVSDFHEELIVELAMMLY